jgi:5-formyltetrahydrofolate cyclo-ligase
MVESRDKLRRATISHRRALAQADCLAWSHSIQARAIALSHYRAAPYVALYSPVENEVATQVILDDAMSSGKMVFYPKLNSSGSSDFARFVPLTTSLMEVSVSLSRRSGFYSAWRVRQPDRIRSRGIVRSVR